MGWHAVSDLSGSDGKGKKVHTKPNIYVLISVERKTDGPNSDKLIVSIDDLFMNNTGENMTHFDFTYKLRFKCVENDNDVSHTMLLLDLDKGVLNNKLDVSGDVSLMNKLKCNKKFEFALGNYLSKLTISVEIKCEATLESGSGNGCHILGDKRGDSKLTWYQVGISKTVAAYIPFKNPKLSLVATGKTINAKLTWTNGNVDSGSNIQIDNNTFPTNITHYINGGGTTFNNLTPGSKHTIYYIITDGITTIKGNSTITTLFAKLLALDRSTKIIKFNLSGTSGKTITWSCNNGSSGNGTGDKTVSNLTHNTKWTVTAQVDNVADTKVTLDIYTKNFSVETSNNKAHQFYIEGTCQAKADGDNYDKDLLDNKVITYSAIITKIGSVVWVNGSESNKKFVFNNLISYTNYRMKISAYDGYNTVITEVDIMTLYPYVRLYNNDKWYKAMVYIYTGEDWSLCKTNIHNGSNFVETSAE